MKKKSIPRIILIAALVVSTILSVTGCDFFNRNNHNNDNINPPPPEPTAMNQQKLWEIINNYILPKLGSMRDGRELLKAYQLEPKFEVTQNIYINGSCVIGEDSADLDHIWYKEYYRNPSVNGENDANFAKDITLKKLTRYKLVKFIKLFRNYKDVDEAFNEYVNSVS